MKVIGIGHSTFDTTLPVPEYPIENNKYRITKHIECGGGSAANATYLLAKWGLDTTMISAVGTDYYGDCIVKEFKNAGTDTTYLKQVSEHLTSSSYILANTSNGTRTIITSKDKPIERLDVPITSLKADLIMLDGEHPLTTLELLNNNPKAISVFDASHLTLENLAIGKKVTYLVCSHEFAENFTDIKLDYNDMEILKKCYEQLRVYFKTNIIITLESSGSFTKIDDEYKKIPSVKVKAVDSTGSGDIFHGAFAYFIANGYKLEDAIHYASIAGAISVTRVGARFSIPTLEEVLEYDDII